MFIIKSLLSLLLMFGLVSCESTRPTSILKRQVNESTEFLNATEIEKSMEYTIIPSLELQFDPDNATSYWYKLKVFNKSEYNVIVDVNISVDGKIVKEHTVQIEPYKVCDREGEMRFDKSESRTFWVKVAHVGIMDKK